MLLNIISILLDYPDDTLAEHAEEVIDIIEQSPISRVYKQNLVEFVRKRAQMNLLDWQAEYDGIFERGRSLGLWLFEHVHGESRDRGMAMVELTAKYREAGLEISQRQLPDYIPMFLEFLATQGEESARVWLGDVEHILALLQCRLERRDSNYAVLFATLLHFAKSKIDINEFRKSVEKEKRDDTKQAIDKEWEEEEVTFGADSLDNACDGSHRKPSAAQRRDLDAPLNWVDANNRSSNAAGGAL